MQLVLVSIKDFHDLFEFAAALGFVDAKCVSQVGLLEVCLSRIAALTL